MLHLTISCTNALEVVRLGISATFHHGRPTYAMDLVYASVDDGARAEALLDQHPSGTLTPIARTRAMNEIVRFAERATAAGRGGDIKAILLGRGVAWLADDGPDKEELQARLKAAGLTELLGAIFLFKRLIFLFKRLMFPLKRLIFRQKRLILC